jgi:hypothetical protein
VGAIENPTEQESLHMPALLFSMIRRLGFGWVFNPVLKSILSSHVFHAKAQLETQVALVVLLD